MGKAFKLACMDQTGKSKHGQEWMIVRERERRAPENGRAEKPSGSNYKKEIQSTHTHTHFQQNIDILPAISSCSMLPSGMIVTQQFDQKRKKGAFETSAPKLMVHTQLIRPWLPQLPSNRKHKTKQRRKHFLQCHTRTPRTGQWAGQGIQNKKSPREAKASSKEITCEPNKNHVGGQQKKNQRNLTM